MFDLQDLKKFHYYYWFAFPAPNQPTVYIKEKSASITSLLNNKQIESFAQSYKTLDKDQKCFFAITKEEDTVVTKTLSSILDVNKPIPNDSNTYFVFNDPSNGSNPGWPLRLFLAALLDHCPALVGTDIKVIGLRCNATGGVENSKVFSVAVPKVCIYLCIFVIVIPFNICSNLTSKCQ